MVQILINKTRDGKNYYYYPGVLHKNIMQISLYFSSDQFSGAFLQYIAVQQRFIIVVYKNVSNQTPNLMKI